MEITIANRVFLVACLARNSSNISLHSSQILFRMTGYGPFGSTAKRTFADLRGPPAEESGKGHADERIDNTKRKEGATALCVSAGAWRLFCLPSAVACLCNRELPITGEC